MARRLIRKCTRNARVTDVPNYHEAEYKVRCRSMCLFLGVSEGVPPHNCEANPEAILMLTLVGAGWTTSPLQSYRKKSSVALSTCEPKYVAAAPRSYGCLLP
ncbi:hypothetical protein U9M48_043418 [Paspalum notatum var. saurae]|uniref:Uncharacterized protein n=1 Tax=Paspalum notatum var. saurae TaxID=547442 RepID=A0AAQ3XHC4_PASNO